MANDPDAGKKHYFAQIAPIYAKVTANATQNLFKEILYNRDLSINTNSTVHDNAAGPGTATQALVPWCREHNIVPKITVTDYVPAMIEEFQKLQADCASNDSFWNTIEAKVMDSSTLSDLADNSLSHSLCNFSMFTFTDPMKCLKEVHRTLKSDGLTVFTTWKRFPVSDLLETAQDQVKGTEWGQTHRVPINGPEYLAEGYMAGLIKKAGWKPENIDEFPLRLLVKDGEDWDGLQSFLINSPIKMAATRDWNEEELAKWSNGVKMALKKEKDLYGGVRFEAWVVVARK